MNKTEKLLDTLSIIKESIRYSMFEHNEENFVERAKYDIENIEAIEKILIEYDETKQFASFGKEALCILTTFSIDDQERRKRMVNRIDKHKKVSKYYDELIGNFS